MSAQSQAGSQTHSQGGLPAYLSRQKDGLYVDLSLFPVGGGFEQYIDQLFGNSLLLLDLDYRLLMQLLYDFDAILDVHGIDSKLRLARDIAPFSPQRKALYKSVKIDSQYRRADYFFEQLSVEVEVEVPVYGKPDNEGVVHIVDAIRRVEMQPTRLDMDEFIADMWLKGVRFGIEIGAVAGVIARRESLRMPVAIQLEATEGSDAEIEEACSVLRRDNAPKVLSNGKADLRKFQNRFPQIAKDERLLKKKPRVLGKPGYKVNGAVIEPEIPEDLDLQPLAGPGTRIEKYDGVEYIVSSRDGFLSLDLQTNCISVTEKIENRDGISIKTTGDLALSGNDFIEHGEVQEGRAVEGKNMTFLSAVYGDVVSQGGLILLESNLSNGSAKSIGGDVTTKGRAFNSIIQAWDGKVMVNYAESCVILGRSVAIGHAVNCEIIADTVDIEVAEGCGIAGKKVRLKSAGACRGKQTLVSMLLPDLTKLNAQIQQVLKAIDDCNKIIASKELEMAQIKSNAEVARYLALATSIRQGAVKLTEAHQENWQAMTAKFSKVDSALAKLNADIKEQQERITALQKENAQLMEAREKSGAGVFCQLNVVTGDTLVRSMVASSGIVEFHKSTIAEIKAKLREQGPQQNRIFSDSAGALDWSYSAS